jgi:hypothetical protein
MRTAYRLGIWLALWVTACAIFDGLLRLSGAWLMLGGAVTYLVCSGVDDYLTGATHD